MEKIEQITNNNLSQNVLNFPESPKMMKIWGFCNKDKIPCTVSGITCAQAEGLMTFTELPPKPVNLFYRMSLGGKVKDKDTGEILETVPAPGIICLDYDKVIIDGKIVDENIRNEIRNLYDKGYIEKSISGTGFHVFFEAPKDWNPEDNIVSGNKQPEIFYTDKYVCVTGDAMNPDNLSLIKDDELLYSILKRQKESGKPKGKKVSTPVERKPVDYVKGRRYIRESRLYQGVIPSEFEGDRSRAAQSLLDRMAKVVATKEEMIDFFLKSPFYEKQYCDGSWEDHKANPSYEKAWLQRDIQYAEEDDDIEVVDELPESTFKQNEIRLDLSIFPEEHVLTKYVNYVKQLTNAYPEYSYAGFLFVVSCLTLGRARYIDSHTNTPVKCSVWFMNLGYSTVSHKTTAIKNCRKILNETFMCHPPNVMPFAMSKPASPEGFLQELAEHPTAYMIYDEVGKFITEMQTPRMSSIRDTFCEVYDGEDISLRYSKKTQKKTDEYEVSVKNPFMPTLMATTFDKFFTHSSVIDLTSGYGLRFLYTIPDYLREDYVSSWDDFDKMKAYDEVLAVTCKILKRFNDVDDAEGIVFSFDADAKKLFNEWSQNHQRQYLQEKNEMKLGYLGRLETYVFKLAILNHIMQPKFYEDGKEVVDTDSVRLAIRLCDEYHMPTFLYLEDRIGRRDSYNTQDKIVQYITERKGGQCSRSELMSFMHIPSKRLNDELDALIECNELEQVYLKTDGNSKGKGCIYYIYKG